MASAAVLALISILATCHPVIVESSLHFESDDDVKLLVIMSVKSDASYELNIDADLPSNLNNEEIPAHLLKKLAFIPLKDQKCHFDYINGFPALEELKKPPNVPIPECKFAEPAIPHIDFNNPRGNVFFVVVDTSLAVDAKDLNAFKLKCMDITAMSIRCGYKPSSSSVLLFMCQLTPKAFMEQLYSPTALVDLLGYLAQLHTLKPKDVYMRVLGSKGFAYSGKEFQITMTYELEKHFPRILWPSWLNTHLTLKNAYHLCEKHISCVDRFMDKSFCANVVKDLPQLSLTYAYFVCRILSGDAADGLCPDICRNDPCKNIANAVPGTCITFGFKIHKNDFFCYCNPGFKWELRTGRSAGSGHCAMSASAGSGQMIEPCTRIEMEASCNFEGTSSCTVDRMGDNKRGICKCKPDYEGLDCSIKETDVCLKHMNRGRLLCRSHEKNGICKPLQIIPVPRKGPSNRGEYSCECKENYMRMLNADGFETCTQWNPSLWMDRAVSCGYEAKLTCEIGLNYHCKLFLCDEASIIAYLAAVEGTAACSNNGKCMPQINQDSHALSPDGHCECNAGFSGVLCEADISYYHTWTEWTVCHDRAMVAERYPNLLTEVSPEVSRLSLRFTDCSYTLKRFANGSVPWCLSGKTEVKPCPPLVTDRSRTLKSSDYGVASQTVISMWRVVEIILLLDGLLIIIIGGLLFYQNLVLTKDNLSPPVRR